MTLVRLFFVSICSFAFVQAASASTLDQKLIDFKIVPANPKVGERLALFARVESFTKNETILEATIDDGNTLKFERAGGDLWSVSLNPYAVVGPHQITIRVLVRDQLESTRLQQAINRLNQAIRDLNTQIAATTDPEVIAALTEQRDQKQAEADLLESELENLKVLFKEESFGFSVSSDPANSNYPLITGVSPQVVTTGERTQVTLIGQNFGASPHVKMGGKNASVLSSSATSILVLAPNFDAVGNQEIELTIPANGVEPKKNAFLAGQFFSTNQTALKNFRPVSVVDGYVKVTLGGAAALDATKSYDINSHATEATWVVKKAPVGSIYPVGTVLPSGTLINFTPDKKGIFTVQSKIIELGTDDLLESFPSLVTIEVVQ